MNLELKVVKNKIIVDIRFHMHLHGLILQNKYTCSLQSFCKKLGSSTIELSLRLIFFNAQLGIVTSSNSDSIRFCNLEEDFRRVYHSAKVTNFHVFFQNTSFIRRRFYDTFDRSRDSKLGSFAKKSTGISDSLLQLKLQCFNCGRVFLFASKSA